MAGNRLTEKNGTGTGTATTYTYDDASQLATRKIGAAAATPLTYDADGNQLTDGTTAWSYDLNNRPTTSTTSGITTTWAHDGQGNLTSQTNPSGTTTFGWDINQPTPRLATATTAAGTSSYRYDPVGHLLNLTGSGSTSTAGHDPLGAPTDLVSSAGAIVRAYDYTP